MMFKNTYFKFAVALIALLPFTHAQAMITFDDVVATNVGTTAPITIGGYTFTYTPTTATGGVHAISNNQLLGASNKTNYLVYEAGVGTETFASNSGNFNLTSLDLGGNENFYPLNYTMTITGTRFDNTTVTYYAQIKSAAFTSFTMDNFTNLRSVTLGDMQGGAFVAVDNIQVSPVPEPQTVAMLLVGIAMLAGVPRFRRPLRDESYKS
jgi:hypothetical protein